MGKYSNQTHYECYTPRIREELLALGYKPRYIFNHKVTKNICYVFKLTSEVERVIAKNSDPEKVRQMKEKKKMFRKDTIYKYRAKTHTY